MKVQGNRYINNPEMIKNKVERKQLFLRILFRRMM